MKKITLFISSLLICLSSSAQDSWDSVVYNGNIPNQNNFFDLEVHNSNAMIYAASGDGVTPLLYSSTSGEFGTWVNQNFLTSVIPAGSVNRISKLSYNSSTSKLFFGTGNNFGAQFINVYKTDGSSSSAHGNIPFVHGPAADYQDVSAIEYFSATGSPDSIFACVSSLSGIEIWKTSVTAASPTWIQVLRIQNTSFLYDAVVYNNNLYVSTCGDANGGYVLKTSDGMDWDTVGYGGFGNGQNAQIRSLAVYNGELYAGTANSTDGAQLYKTSNGTSWTQVNVSGLGQSSLLNSIVDMKVINNRLFICANYYNGSYGFVRMLYSNNGTDFNISNLGTDFANNLGNHPDDYRIENFYGAVYCGGANNNYGQIWRLKLPVANFSTGSTTICAGTPRNFTNISTNASVYNWSENGIVVSTSFNYSQTYSTPGTVNLMLRAYNGNIYDSVEVPLNIVPQVTGSLAIAPTQSVCPGEPATITYTPISGTPPYNYSWTTGSGYPAQGNVASFTFNPPNSGNYSLTVSDAIGCTYNGTQGVAMTAPATDISGTITYSGGPVNNGNVYILKYQPTYSGADTVATVPISAGGSYILPGALYGQYLVKADPDTTIAAYENTISTYNGNFFRWDSASPFLHTCAAASTQNIQLLELLPDTGTAVISGYLTEGDGYGQRLMNPQHNPFVVPGGPLKGIDVKLGKNPGGGIQARTSSDTTTGRFQFINVPVGDYRIYVDIPNLPMDSLREVTVVAGTDSIPNNNYIADSIQIYVENTIGIKSSEQTLSNNIKVYPNPAKNDFFIDYTIEKSSDVTVSVLDVVGKQISTETGIEQGRQQKLISTGSWPAGIYFVQLKYDGHCYTMRVIVSR